MSDLSPVVVPSVEPLGLDHLQAIVDDLRGNFGLDAWLDYPGHVSLYVGEYVITFGGEDMSADVMSDDGDYVRSFPLRPASPLRPWEWSLEIVAWDLVNEYVRIVNSLVESE
jgi:hypothetical protein